MNILITGVGGPTPRSFAIALKRYGKNTDYHLIATDANPLSVGLYMPELFDAAYLIPKANEQGYWPAIEQLIAKHKIDIAVILPEQEVMAWSKRKEKNTLPCKALIPDFSIASQLLDKALMTELLAAENLVPKSFTIDSRETLDNSTMQIPFPFWVRSSSGSSGLGSLKVQSLQELKNWMLINPTVTKFLASEFLPGRNLACKLLYFEDKLLRSAIAERVNYIMAKVAPSGITGNTSFGRLLNDKKVFDVSEKAMEILFEKTGAAKHGFFTVDLKEDEKGVPKITEINVRHVAFTQCFAAGGANLAEDTILLLNEDTSFDKNFKLYQFEEGLIFLRDVDIEPVMMLEKDLIKNIL